MQGVSIVVPFLNESEGIMKCCIELEQYRATVNFPIEIVFVDDGSTDSTVELIKSFTFQNLEVVKIISLSKNFGAHAAIRAGILNSSFEICTWIGSDLQEPLEFIALGHMMIFEGYDAIYIEKASVSLPLINKLFSNLYSMLIRKFAVKNFTSNGINNVVLNNKIKNYLNSNIESNSSLVLQIIDAGFTCKMISLHFKARVLGKSKWSFSKKIKLFIDSFVAFSFIPIRMVSIVGIIMFFVGLAFAFYVIIHKLLNPAAPIMGYTTLASIVSIGFGITNISLGIIAEYLWRTYDTARNRPVFIISEVQEIKKEERECLTQMVL